MNSNLNLENDVNIIFSNKNEFDIKVGTIVNDSYIVQIKIGSCFSYITPTEPFIGIIINGKFHIFNLTDHDDFPESLRTELRENKIFIQNLILSESSRTSKNDLQTNLKILEISHKLNYNISNFEYIITPICPDIIDLDLAKKEIDQLNKLLKCDYLSKNTISIDYIFNLKNESITPTNQDKYNLILCLFNDKTCVSSITISQMENYNGTKELMIDSNTNDEYEGRKFNKLLRAVAIIIAKKLDDQNKFVVSNAVNPISLHLMTKYFNAVAYDENDNEISNLKTFTDIKKYIDENGGAFPKVSLTPENIEIARNVFNEIAKNNYTCMKGGKYKTRQKKTKKTKKMRKSNHRKITKKSTKKSKYHKNRKHNTRKR
jgi:hypothetical protein